VINEPLQAKYIGCMIGSALGDTIGEPAFSFADKKYLLMAVERAAELRYTHDTAMAVGLAQSLIENEALDPEHLGWTFHQANGSPFLMGKDEYRISNKEFQIMKFSVVLLGYKGFSSLNNKTNQQHCQDQNPYSTSKFCGSLFDIRYSIGQSLCLQPFEKGGRARPLK